MVYSRTNRCTSFRACTQYRFLRSVGRMKPAECSLYLSSLPLDVEKSTRMDSSYRHPTRHNQSVLKTEARLPEIDLASLSLHYALHHFRPLDDRYANKPLEEAFNWKELDLPKDEEREWYCVAFRSRKKAGYNAKEFSEADREVHEEAVQNGGLLMYWYGIPDPVTEFNLATHIWRSRTHAIARRTQHVRAKRLAPDSYETFAIERYVLKKRRGTNEIELEKYVDGEVGWYDR